MGESYLGAPGPSDQEEYGAGEDGEQVRGVHDTAFQRLGTLSMMVSFPQVLFAVAPLHSTVF